MPPVLVMSTGCQAGAYFDNDVIPPGAPRLKLPWAYSYAQFAALLAAYLDVHPEDFVTFGIFQKQPRRGSYREWGEVAGLLSHMIGGRRSLVTELMTIINKIQRLQHGDPMRGIEEQALVALLLRERRRSGVPLGDGAFSQLVAPGDRSGILPNQAHWGPHETPIVVHNHLPPPGPGPPPGPSGAQDGPHRPPPGFLEMVNLTADADTEKEEMDKAPVTPSPNVSDGSDTKTDEDKDVLTYTGEGRDGADSSDEDGFQHV